MPKKWVEELVPLAKEAYAAVLGEDLSIEIEVVEGDWKSRLKEEGITPRENPAVYLLDRILIHESATYFDLLHELGHEALYQTTGVKDRIAAARANGDPETIRALESKLPLEFIEYSATQYAKILGASMKQRLPEVISVYLEGQGVVFAAFNGSVQRTGWGQDIDVWVVLPDNYLESKRKITFPSEWDVEVLPESVFNEGVAHADGILIDLAACGSVVLDNAGAETVLKGYLHKKPTTEEVRYHQSMSKALFALSKVRFYEARYRNKILDAFGKSFSDPDPAGVLNPLHYALSYQYLAKEYSVGNRPLISKALDDVPSLRLFRAIRKSGVVTEDIFALAERYISG